MIFVWKSGLPWRIKYVSKLKKERRKKKIKEKRKKKGKSWRRSFSHSFMNIKPWELGQLQNNSSQMLKSKVNGEPFSSKVQENGVNYQFDGKIVMSWWQQKNARMTEIENEDEPKAGPHAT